ncbi:hypothetical protein JOQ06_027279 [Pogonophryne albipinna]|uniref:Uncharacterized protein n=1 Tax=Pogonophryne albipinna TaxID=1090488 RepID=A0AAD6FNJ3_9TELE|nr:hypothetical protein JOQ06_027279 [Pogonophryne albipinna]
MLKEKQRLLQLPEHKLMTDVVTRWNSAHDMLERFLEQQPAICAALLWREVRKTEKDLCTLTESDVTTAEEVVIALKPMKEATQYMSKEKTPTLSVIAALQDTLIDGLKPIEGESAVIKEMKAAMSGDLQRRYIDLKATLHACSAMDPRFKSLPFLTENQRQEVYDGLIAEAQDQPMPSELSLWSVVEEAQEHVMVALMMKRLEMMVCDSRKERAVKVSILHPGIQSRLVHWLPFLVVNDTVVEHNPRQIPKRTRPSSR